MWVKKFAEFALSGTVFEIQASLCFAIFCEKFKMAAIFGGTKIRSATEQSYPTDQTFSRNCSI